MRVAIVVLALFCLSGSALAGGNPDVRGHIDFDPPNGVHSIDPAPGETIHAYVCLDYLSMGFTTVCFRLTDVMSEYPGVFSSWSFTNLLPGNLAIGDPFTGIVMASTECLVGPTVVVGVLHLEYSGGDACIEILEHPEHLRWVYDCSDPATTDYFHVTVHGKVGDACCLPGEFGASVRCEPQGGDDPVHPPRYWYDTYLWNDSAGIFRVQVFDADPANYTNWVAPEYYPNPWTYGLEEGIDGTWWAVWRTGPTPWLGGYARFGFDNPNASVWGHWQYGSHESEDFSSLSNGCGYRVHVPEGSTSVNEDSTWGTIKALYR